MKETKEQAVNRMLNAIYPNRFEKIMSAIVSYSYEKSEAGVWGWIGDRADDLRCFSSRIRRFKGRR